MSNVVSFFREATKDDYQEIAPGVWALSWDNARLCPGALCNDPVLGAQEYNRYQTLNRRKLADPKMAEISGLFEDCFKKADLHSAMLACAFKTAFDPSCPLPSSFDDSLNQLTSEQKLTIFFVLNSSHLVQTAFKSADLARLMALKISVL